jgi:glycosyltransferase involved in cell wall biosynthesis
MRYRRSAGSIVHAPPDHAILVTPASSRLVVTLHNYYLDPEFRGSGSLIQRIHYRTDLRWLTRRAVERADVVTAVSSYIAKLACADLGFRGKIEVIPNGIDLTRFSPSPAAHRGVRILFCGNMLARKGAHLLAPIAARLLPDIELWIASGLRGAPQRGSCPANVRMLGPVPHAEMPALYHQIDILLLPTLREGFGLVVAEAMASGLPVVATRCSAIPELVDHEKGGFLAAAGDVEQFADYLNRLAQDAVLRKTMGDYNRLRAEARFNEEAMVARYASVFRNLA